jgi:hypothetical protein
VTITGKLPLSSADGEIQIAIPIVLCAAATRAKHSDAKHSDIEKSFVRSRRDQNALHSIFTRLRKRTSDKAGR